MSLYLKLKPRLPEFNIELVTLDNLDRYENIFYCNSEYYLITEGHPATKRDCMETIQYGNDFPKDMCYCIGFSLKDKAVALLSILEGYPETDTLYIGLFLVNEDFKRKSIGTKSSKSDCSNGGSVSSQITFFLIYLNSFLIFL